MNNVFLFLIAFFTLQFALAKKVDSVFNCLDDSGLKQGVWQKKYPNGKLAYRAYFVDDKATGLLMRYHENGKKMAVIDCFDDGSAFAQLFSPNGKLVAQGNYWGENRKNGQWKYFNDDKLIREENYTSGVLHGAVILYFPNGNVYERKQYTKGEQSGVYEQINEHGNLVFEMQYKHGQPHGKARYYYNNNQCRIEAHYKEGIRDGLWTYYKMNGDIERHTIYTAGVAADKDSVDDANSQYLKSLEKERGKFIEPQDRFNNIED
ncbi:MAG: toxin-antitoxin system YwqK family antitoxin [Bacteroidales bacterium]